VNPRDGSVWRTVRARDLFAKIVRYAHHNGEPGALFIDAANRTNPVPQLYQLEATNPCITGETLIYTEHGLRRAHELAAAGAAVRVATDGRFGADTLLPASPVFATGVKDVYRLLTREGYEVRLTEDHRVMTARGWVPAGQLQPGDRVHILNALAGSARPVRWKKAALGFVGDGTINAARGEVVLRRREARTRADVRFIR
jgi:ribonucleoside-diphosphate reductase alpha chain